VLPSGEGHVGQVARRLSLREEVAQLARQRVRFLVQGRGRRQVALAEGDPPQLDQGPGDSVAVPEGTPGRERRGHVGPRLGVVAPFHDRDAEGESCMRLPPDIAERTELR
jgi:hypothetical protein